MKTLLVTVDSLRKDHFEHMPETFAFLDDTHERTFASFTATLGSFQSMIGGEYPTSGHLTDSKSVVSEFDCRTVGITTNHLLSERYGYDKGFEYFRSPLTDSSRSVKDRIAKKIPSGSTTYRLAALTWNKFQSITSQFNEVEKSYRPAKDVVDEFLVEIADDDEWFGWLHFMEPHHPYDPQEGPVGRLEAQQASRRAISGSGTETDFELVPELYRREIEELDEQLATLWDALSDDVFVVFCADHGELLGEGGHWGHPNDLRPEILNVPFGTRNGPDLGEIVSLVDVPTILSGEEFGVGTLDRETAFASVADKKAAMNRRHIATEEGVRTLQGEPAEDPGLTRALDRFDPEYVVKEDAVKEDLEKLGYV